MRLAGSASSTFLPGLAGSGRASSISAAAACSLPNGIRTARKPTRTTSRTITRLKGRAGICEKPDRSSRSTTFCSLDFPASRSQLQACPRKTRWVVRTASLRYADLFFDTAQIIKHHEPSAFVLENVKNLESHDDGTHVRDHHECAGKRAWLSRQSKVISSEPWVPQKRQRIFIIGFKKETAFDFDKVEPARLPKRAETGTILEENVDPKYTLTEHLWNYLQGYKAKHAGKGNGFGFSLFGRTMSRGRFPSATTRTAPKSSSTASGNRPRRLTPA